MWQKRLPQNGLEDATTLHGCCCGAVDGNAQLYKSLWITLGVGFCGWPTSWNCHAAARCGSSSQETRQPQRVPVQQPTMAGEPGAGVQQRLLIGAERIGLWAAERCGLRSKVQENKCIHARRVLCSSMSRMGEQSIVAER